MPASLIVVPYHFGREHTGVGLGPARLLDAGAGETLPLPERLHSIETIERQQPFDDALSAIWDVNRLIALAVNHAIGRSSMPLVVAGNCNSCLGVLSGLQTADARKRTGVVWFDAHADFHIPGTSQSGSPDGMALAAALGHCELGGHLADKDWIAERDTLLLGVRDIDPKEDTRLEASSVKVIGGAALKSGNLGDVLAPYLRELREDVEQIYLHMDLDVLDPMESPGVNFQGCGGLSFQQLREAIEVVRRHLYVAAATISNYNPDLDCEDRTLKIGLELIDILSGT